MHEALKGLSPLTFESARHLRTDSERLFASGFLAWFHDWPHLYPEPFKVSVEGVGYTIPDFATEYNGKDMMLYEVTLTKDTTRKSRKVQQQRIYRHYTGSRIHVKAMEINGGALECIDTTMEILEQLYHHRLSIDHAQEEINALGRNPVAFQAAMLRELARI